MWLVGVAASWACGGFFCDAGPSPSPVDQAAERIVFSLAPGEVTVHVQIAYVGEAHSFAWVVPVAGVPTIGLSNDALFTFLGDATVPMFFLGRDLTSCQRSRGVSDSDGGEAGSGGGEVDVLATEDVGPYETVTLAADDPAALVAWLQAHDYAVPDTLDDALAPYVAARQSFVALRLRSEATTGDLAPIELTYPGDRASVPLRLTGIAAAEDMPIQVYVLGASRAVPDNYLHVAVNHAGVDWWGGGTGFRGRIARAVDEAGGRAFTTDFSGPTSSLRTGLLRVPSASELAHLRKQTDYDDWRRLVREGTAPSRQLDAAILRAGEDFEPNAATDLLEAEVVGPLSRARAMFTRSAWLTRLSTAMSPHEMTEDPVFVVNADVTQDVASQHFATETFGCGWGSDVSTARREVELPDGRQFELPNLAFFAEHGSREVDYIAPLADPAALVIEDLGATGEGTVLFDGRAEAADAARRFGRGCATGPTATAWVAAAGLLLRRRRA